MNNKTLYVTDMDGTLLNSDSIVSSRSAEILSELSDMGALVTVATARTPATVVGLLKGTRLSLPAIVMTGAAMYRLDTGRYENVHFLDPEVAATALRMFEDAGVNPFVYTLRDDHIIHAFHAGAMNKAEESFYAIRRDLSLKKFHIAERPTADDLSRTVLMFCVGDKILFERLSAQMTEQIGYPVTCYNDIFNDNNAYIEVFAPGVSKAAAVSQLARRSGADRVVAFGDNFNDLSMMESADLGVAVSNAYPEVKDRAGLVIASNAEDAVPRWIYRDFTGCDWV